MRKLLLAGLVAAPAMAGPLQWQDNSLSYLYGQNYKVTPGTQQTLTVEHASGWNFGDLFFFTDFTHFNGTSGDSNTYYGEFSPRFSAGKLLGKDLAFGPVTDVLLATTYEFGEGNVETLLAGPGFDLKLPGFDFFQLNFYQRMPRNGRDGHTVQVTPVWKMRFPVGDSQVVFDGFMDWVVNSDGVYHANLHFNPQLKYDLGPALGLHKDKLFVGLEYDYWKNRFGIKDSPAFRTNQNTASLLVKYHF
ncbi:outer membrane protein OmpK [Gallaecimonas kandeliae]|uniref:outer membrane protein OmpK n=1 Tax=Gallaecimonas kandeliae TaxID=3029055 RepID=UPI002649D41D|nr:outer membrane protein OmpK [Gallaecimonas kandeliae]WKE66348.1 outer membrane protein OmpK [Gallaecimonas kandeliae]